MAVQSSFAQIEKRRIVDSFEYKNIFKIEIEKNQYEVNSWRKTLVLVCQLMSKKDINKFESLKWNNNFKGVSRYYFTDEEIPGMTKRVGETDVYVWVNNNANTTASIIKKVLRYFEIDPYEVYAYVSER